MSDSQKYLAPRDDDAFVGAPPPPPNVSTWEWHDGAGGFVNHEWQDSTDAQFQA